MDKLERLKRFLRRISDIHAIERGVLWAFFGAALLGGILLGVIIHSTHSSQDLDRLASFRPTLPTRIYDVRGRLVAELFQHQREMLSIDEIPASVIVPFLAVEDSNFYKHFGLDFGGIFRALWENIKAGRIVQGGSTLTQQLVKGLYTKGEKTLFRKIYEAFLAIQVESEFSKEEILEMYFNQIYLGHGTYGIGSAARFYFNKHISELNLIEGSILAALPKAPHGYSPFRSPHKARKKNKIVLNLLVEKGHLTQKQAKKSYQKFWKNFWPRVVSTPPTKTIFGEKKDKAPYFTEYLRQELVGLFGEEGVYRRGLQVYSSLNLDHQLAAEKFLLPAIDAQTPIARRSNENLTNAVDPTALSTYNLFRNVFPLPGIIRKYSLRNDFRKKFKKQISDAFELLSLVVPGVVQNEFSKNFIGSTRDFRSNLKAQGAFISIDHKTGRITSMIGGREFKASDQFNRAVLARRQPGSAFKPFVYGAALEDRAVHSAMGFLDSPLINLQSDGSSWAPSNYSGGYSGYVLLNHALALSLNLVSVQLYDKVGPEKIIDFASRLTKVAPRRFQPNPSLSLGSSELTPFELALGFSIIANKGREVIPHSIIYITDRDGNVIEHVENKVFEVLNYKKENNQDQIIEKAIAYILRRMMEKVVSGGSGNKVRSTGGYLGPAAGKTGTTSGWHDAWFGGFNEELTAVTWLGLDNGHMTLGRHQSGGEIAAPIWGKVFHQIYPDISKLKEFDSTIPEGVIQGGVNALTGKWLNEECNQNATSTLIPAPIEIDGQIKKVIDEKDDCSGVKTRSLLEIMQEQNEISDEEIGKTKRFRSYEQN